MSFSTLLAAIFTIVAFVPVLFILYPVVVRLRRRRQQPRATRLEVISDPQDAKFEIIAVHGLGADPEYTWVGKAVPHKDSTPTEKVHLLRDLLKNDFPDARILNFPHNSDWLVDAPVKTAQQIGNKLLSEVKQWRDERPSPRLPIIFIGHSFGGIVIKEAICKAGPALNDIVNDTCGIVFLGTPHQGTSASYAGIIFSYTMSFLGSSTALLLSLRNHRAALSDLEDQFGSFMESRPGHKLSIKSFYETKQTFLFGWVPLGVIVSRNSASGRYGRSVSLDTDHSGLNKCTGRNQSPYKELEIAVRDLRAPSILELADTFIRTKIYDKKRLDIVRLSGDCLPMDKCYINVAIITRSQQDSSSLPYESSLSAGLKSETPEGNLQVELSSIFYRTEEAQSHAKGRRRILIRGRAGIGKTTLCKKIVHDFVHQRTWNGLFDRLLWVPLRRLKGLTGRGYNLESLIYDEFFSQCEDGKSLAKELWGNIEKTNGARTLFILDGLDEVSGEWNSDDHMHSFLTGLLDQPNVIITSRPYADYMAGPVDIELETVGFCSEQVESYLSSVAFPSNQERVDEVQSFLEARSLMEDLVRIPIQLDALCFIWDVDTGFGTAPQTITAAYRSIELKLWGKDAVRLGKYQDEIPITEARIQKCLPTEIKRLISAETHFLEVLAFNGLFNDVIDFDMKHREMLAEQFQSSTETVVDWKMPSLSFLRTSDHEGPIQSYHFLHLTFQEYFAARYFAGHWTKKHLSYLNFSSRTLHFVSPFEFLQRHKYTARFNVFWRFVAGLLDEIGIASKFFVDLEEAPRDLLGSVHQRLVTSCLSEVSSNASFRPDLETKLLDWLLFKFSFDWLPNYINPELPGRVVEAVLQQGTTTQLCNCLRSMNSSITPKLSPEVLLQTVALVRHTNKYIRESAIEVLGVQKTLPENVSKAIISLFMEERCSIKEPLSMAKHDIQEAPTHYLWDRPQCLDLLLTLLEELATQSASESPGRRTEQNLTLRNDAELFENFLDRLLRTSENMVSWARVNSTYFSTQGKITRSALHKLVPKILEARIGHPEPQIRVTMLTILGRSSCLCQPLLDAVASRLEDEDLNVRRAAISTLIRQPMMIHDRIIELIVSRLGDEDNVTQSKVIEWLIKDLGIPTVILDYMASKPEHKPPIITGGIISGLSRRLHGHNFELPTEAIAKLSLSLRNENPEIRCLAARVLGIFSGLPHDVLETLKLNLEDENPQVKLQIIRALGEQSNLATEILKALASCLGDGNPEVRSGAASALGRQRPLPTEIINALLSGLGDENPGVRVAVASTLGQLQSLPTNILKALLCGLGDESCGVRLTIIKILADQPRLTAKDLQTLLRRLGDEQPGVIAEFACTLWRNCISQESHKTLRSLFLRCLNTEDRWVRSGILMRLGHLKELPIEIVRAIAAQLHDEVPSIIFSCFFALDSQTTLPQDIIDSLEEVAKSHKEEWIAVQAAETVFNRGANSSEILRRIKTHIICSDEEWTESAFKIWGDRQDLPSEILEALFTRVKNDERIEFYVEKLLRHRESLPEEILASLVERLDSEDCSTAEEILRQHSGYFATLLSGQHMPALYKALLRKSFDDGIYWYIEDGMSCVSLPGGTIIKSFIQEGEEKFLVKMEEARLDLMNTSVDNM